MVWFDAFATNPDPTAQNPNILVWHGRPWLIDHGAALYVHHTWKDPAAHARRPFERIRDHILLPFAGPISAADDRLAPLVTRALLEELVASIPDTWLTEIPLGDAATQRRAYVDYLAARLAHPRSFVAEADDARAA